ncbi:MAG: hypothetical protein RJA22_1881 [Verrucomicrobiota bacterium]|jgi:putative membrane-bound dehydrogenase-like protein
MTLKVVALTLTCLCLSPAWVAAAPKPAKPAQPAPRVLPLAEAREKEAALLKEVKVAEGFEATLFAAPPAVNYPVFVAAAPDGTLYVSSDGNGSLGREPHLGRVLRLRDVDDDGRADEVKVFVDDIDSPRGLAWDQGRLYLLHPPHLSVCIDRDGDGVAEQRQVLVKNIAFGFKDRPADHTSNGIELGVDGWIYAAIGDFGFLEAEGTDGRRLQLRGGGVVRVRPDGTGLELFCRGTRNILEVAVGPLLDGFARDNTNDGGGWDVRFHHFTGLGEHGYPSLYKNFPEDIRMPLSDYGGGSGCGAAWIDEAGWPAEWNNAPYTADWGHGAIYKHTVEPRGGTFAETRKPAALIRMPRPTDLDVDARGRAYAASWKGATFNWNGPDVGYIVRVQPKGHAPARLPDYDRATPGLALRGLAARGHRERLAAQRALIQLGPSAANLTAARAIAASGKTAGAAAADAHDHGKDGHSHEPGGVPLASRVAALFYLQEAGGPQAATILPHLASDPALAPWVLRALTDDPDRLTNILAAPLLEGLQSADARTRREAAFSLARLGDARHGRALSRLLADPDPVVVHTAVHALARLRASLPCFSVVDTAPVDSPQRAAALRALRQMHDPRVVGHLLARLNAETNALRLPGLFTTLCRLHDREGTWTGNSWGTRPDTSGPYYQPETWEASAQISAALQQALTRAAGKGSDVLVAELARHKILSAPILATVVELTAQDPALVMPAVNLLARAEKLPAGGMPLLARVAGAEDRPAAARAQAVTALAKAGGTDGLTAALAALPRLPDAKSAREAFLNSTKLAEQVPLLASTAGALGAPGPWADAALLRVSERKGTPAAAREAARQSLQAGWATPARRAQILEAVALAEHKAYKDQVLAAATDPDPAVASAARRAATALRMEKELKSAATPAAGQGTPARVDALPPAEVVRSVLATRGDAKAGEGLFQKLGCANCHTVAAGEPLRGPYLGNIARIYKRADLAEAILLPGKSIAQGFAAHRFELKDGEEHEGFVIQEAADTVTLRNIAAQEIQLRTADIARRQKLDKSLMPEGLASSLTLTEFASLLDYLEKLATP